MANSYFQFRQFTIHQEQCAMKVGTDGVLLGAWADVPQGATRVLDIGTGTGLLALMMAQRFPQVSVTGIDIEADAVCQARENASRSPFADRVTIFQHDIRQPLQSLPFSAIVCNPPFFANALTSPDPQRTTARHAVSLSFQSLANAAFRLLTSDGLFSVIIPDDGLHQMETAASMAGFFITRLCAVRTVPRKATRRFLMELRKQPADEPLRDEAILQTETGERSAWYQQLIQDFYIR